MEQIRNLIRKTERLQAERKTFEVDEKSSESMALAKEMHLHFGEKSRGRIYALFSHPKYTHRQIKDAWIDYQKGSIKGLRFFMWKLNNMR